MGNFHSAQARRFQPARLSARAAFVRRVCPVEASRIRRVPVSGWGRTRQAGNFRHTSLRSVTYKADAKGLSYDVTGENESARPVSEICPDGKKPTACMWAIARISFRGAASATERRRKKLIANFARWSRKRWRICSVKARNCLRPALARCVRLSRHNRPSVQVISPAFG